MVNLTGQYAKHRLTRTVLALLDLAEPCVASGSPGHASNSGRHVCFEPEPVFWSGQLNNGNGVNLEVPIGASGVVGFDREDSACIYSAGCGHRAGG